MSSKAERRARSSSQQKRSHMKSLRRKRNISDESADNSRTLCDSISFLNTMNALSRDSTPSKKQRKKQNNSSSEKTKSSESTTLTNQFPLCTTFSSNPILKNNWKGDPGQENPSDDLKLMRRNIGVLVRGNLGNCPPPIAEITHPSLPSSFAKVFQTLKLSQPTAIQMQCWPAVMAGSNVLCIAPTGSGKTIAYLLPMVPHIKNQLESSENRSDRKEKPSPYALVLVPTRELAIQVTTAWKPVKKCCEDSMRAVALYGGQDRDTQLSELDTFNPEIVIATPGRLIDLVQSQRISLSKVTYLVLDEADRMLVMGFFDQLEAISRMIRPDRQTLLFTATFPGK